MSTKLASRVQDNLDEIGGALFGLDSLLTELAEIELRVRQANQRAAGLERVLGPVHERADLIRNYVGKARAVMVAVQREREAANGVTNHTLPVEHTRSYE